MVTRARILEILPELGIDIPRNVDKIKELVIPCPMHEDNKPSFSLNLDNGLWFCFSEDEGGSFRELISEVLGLSLMEASSMILEGNTDFFEDWEEEPQARVSNTPTAIRGLPFPPTDNFPQWILDRGFEVETLTDWGCTVNSSTGSLIVPIRDSKGALTGWVSRKVKGTPKYVYSEGVEISKLLFGLDRIPMDADQIYITEGTLDAIWLNQHNFPAVAMLGLHMSEIQLGLLLTRRPKEVILCLDKDPDQTVVKGKKSFVRNPGQDATEKLKKRLTNYCIVSTIDIPEGYKDVQDIRDPQELRRVLGGTLQISF